MQIDLFLTGGATSTSQPWKGDANGNGLVAMASSVPSGAVEKGSASADVAASAAVATLAATAAKTNRLTAVIIAGLGATAAGSADLTITGLLGGTVTIPIPVPALPAGLQPIVLTFPGGLPGSAVNTAIVVTLASLGAGNLEAAVAAYGYAV